MLGEFLFSQAFVLDVIKEGWSKINVKTFWVRLVASARLILLVSIAVGQSVSTALTCGFPHLVISAYPASSHLAAGHHDRSLKQVLQSGLHLAHHFLCCRYAKK